MKLPLFIADAFSSVPFGGNPAAVCPLKEDITDELKQKIAAEMNLSETAFVQPLTPSSTDDDLYSAFETLDEFKLRWFTPKVEVKLCGHATLATSAIIFGHYGNTNNVLKFRTKSGTLTVTRVKGESSLRLQMQFPSNYPNISIKPSQDEPIQRLISVVLDGKFPVGEVRLNENTKKLLIEIKLNDKKELEAMKSPNFNQMISIDTGDRIRGVFVTGHEKSSGKGYDFVSRYFAPWVGIDEDPVCGSAHTVSAPFWAEKLKKTKMFATQCSPRGGEIWLSVEEDSILMSGDAKIMLKGEIDI